MGENPITNVIPMPKPVSTVQPEWYQHLQRDSRNRTKLLLVESNITDALQYCPQWKNVISRDLITGTVYYDSQMPDLVHLNLPIGQWNDLHTYALVRWLASHGMVFKPKVVMDAVKAHGLRYEATPVKDYLLSLKWDGKPRILRALITYFGESDNSLTTFDKARCFFISAVARAINPGCKVDTILILEGPQGARKSTAVEILGKQWYGRLSEKDVSTKDAKQILLTKWIMELPELVCFKYADDERIKDFIESKTLNFRPPYGHSPIDFKLAGIKVGTTNPRQYLKDVTGNRRFHCVNVETIDIEGLERDVDQLWAEAVVRYNDGWKWYIEDIPENRDILKALAEENGLKAPEVANLDIVENTVKAVMQERKTEWYHWQYVTMADVIKRIREHGNEKYFRHITSEVSNVLIHNLGFTRKRDTTLPTRPTIYVKDLVYLDHQTKVLEDAKREELEHNEQLALWEKDQVQE